MNNRNPKIFKFPRKEMQISDELNKKKAENAREKVSVTVQPGKITKEEPKERANLALSKESAAASAKEEEEKASKERVLPRDAGEHCSKSEQFMRMSEKGVLFEKKLTKLVLPDHIEKVKIVSKIENKLLSCLQKKKPLIPMKKLVNMDMLNEILGKKQRKLVTDRPHFTDNLDVEAHSLRKNEERTQPVQSKRAIPQESLPEGGAEAQDARLRMKLMPLRVPVFQAEGQDHFFQEEGSNFIFQAAGGAEFSFFNEEDTIFDTSNQQNEVGISFQQTYQPKPNFFEERKSSFIERQAKSTFFANMNQLEFDEKLFNSQKRRPPSPIFPCRPRILESEFDVGRLKLPRAEQPRRHEGSGGFSIFPIEEEPSHFFSPEKQQRERNRGMGNGHQSQADHFWRGRQSSSGSQDIYY